MGVAYRNTPISFQPEVGSVSTPVLRSLQRFLSTKSLKHFPSENAGTESADVDEEWRFHKYISYTSNVTDQQGDTRFYDHIYAYGVPSNAEEYSWRAQLVQYVQYKSLFEGYSLHQWRYYAAVVFWKSQSPWPTLRGALYDYYLDYTAGFWGVRAATSFPLHIQLNPKSYVVSVVNRGTCQYNDVFGYVTLFDMDGNVYNKYVIKFGDVAGNSVSTYAEAIEWPILSAGEEFQLELIFIRLELDKSIYNNHNANCFHDKIRSQRNVYWLPHPSKQYHPRNFELLSFYRNKMSVKLQLHWDIINDNNSKNYQTNIDYLNLNNDYYNKNNTVLKWVINILNPLENKEVAFMIRLTLLKGMKLRNNLDSSSNEQSSYDPRVLSTWFSDNYITLLPGESIIVFMETRHMMEANQELKYSLEMEGWNVKREVYP